MESYCHTYRTKAEKDFLAELKAMREEIEYYQLYTELLLLEHSLRLKAGFDPNQPRVPAGDPDGGQWTDGGGGSGTDNEGGGAGRFEALPRAESKPDIVSKPRNNTVGKTTTYKDIDGRTKAIPKGVGNPGKFQEHLDRHGKHFNVKSGKDLNRQALKFRSEGIKQKLPMVEDKNGVLRIYDPKTNRFGAYNPDKTWKTYMKPKDNNPIKGQEYYQRVVEKTVNEGGKVINQLPSRGSGRGVGFINPKDDFDEFPDDDLLN